MNYLNVIIPLETPVEYRIFTIKNKKFKIVFKSFFSAKNLFF